jgi:hypothetical protein
MGDWNTLHLFDSKKFYKDIVPDLKGEGKLFHIYFNSELGKLLYLYRDGKIPNLELRIDNMIKFCRDLLDDFKRNKVLYDIETRQRKPNEGHSIYIQIKNQNRNDFEKEFGNVIEDLSRILPLIIFSECAMFNPHLILGRRIFSGCVQSKKESLAEICCAKIEHIEVGSAFCTFGSGIMNWLTYEDVNLLMLDRHNLSPQDKESEKYFSDFMAFLKIADDNGLGLLSGMNMNEGILKLIKNPALHLAIDLKKLNLQSVIRYE